MISVRSGYLPEFVDAVSPVPAPESIQLSSYHPERQIGITQHSSVFGGISLKLPVKPCAYA